VSHVERFFPPHMTISGLSVRCDDESVRDALSAWLGELRLDTPTPLTLSVTIGEVPEIDSSPVVFEQPEILFHRGSSEQGRGVRLTWLVAPATATVATGSTTAWVVLSPGAVKRLDRCTRTFLMAVVIMLARQAGWFHLHAATAIDPTGRGWLIAGDAHAGKSTTAALLAASGWRVGSDDVAFIERRADRVVVHACRARIARREGGQRLLARGGGIDLPARRKVGYWPEELGGGWTPLVAPEIIIFTAVGQGRDPTVAEPLGRLEAATELVRWSAWVILEPDLAQDHLERLTRLTQQARCYRVTLGRDLFARPNRLIELVT
jgi:hypothetical protein